MSITHLEFRRAGECSIPRITLVRTSIPDVGLSDLADPERLALVSAFRAEVATTRRRWPSAPTSPTTRGRRGTLPGPATSTGALLPIRERVLGPDHRDTLATRDNLAYWTREADRSEN